MKVLLITGADGWLGRAIVKKLLESDKFFKNFNYLVLHSLSKKKFLNEDSIKTFKNNGISLLFINGALEDNSLSKNFLKISKENVFSELNIIYTSSIIHCKKVKDFFEINYVGLKNFYNNLDKSILKKFTYISSNSPFGFNKKGILFDEFSKYKPLGGYGHSKQLAEEFLLSIQNEKVITIIRAPWFHGNDMPDRQINFLRKASKGNFPIIGFGKNKRSLVNTLDLAVASLNVTFSNRKNNIYWISELNSYSMHFILKIIQKSYGKRVKKSFKNKIKFLMLPIGFSSICCVIDLFLQKLGIYNMYLHVLGELGQNIECSSKKYRDEFPDHEWHEFPNSIDDELNEAFKK